MVDSPKQNTLTGKIRSVLMTYVKTQLLVAGIVGIATWLLLTFLGIPYAWLLSAVAGILSVVPMFGMVPAAIVIAFVAVFDGVRFLPKLPEFFEGIAVLLLFGLLNVGVDFFLAPYIVGKQTKVHPLVMILAVIAGTVFFGFFGALLAVPVLLVLLIVNDHVQKRKS